LPVSRPSIIGSLPDSPVPPGRPSNSIPRQDLKGLSSTASLSIHFEP
jgi:hypothetical protein